MGRARAGLWLASFVCGFAFTGTALRADSITTNYSPNYVAIRAEAQGAYVGPTVTDFDANVVDFATAAHDDLELHPPYRNNVNATTTVLPSSGAAKDQVHGSLGVFMDFGGLGDPSTNDQIVFDVDSIVSASNSRNSVAEEAAGSLKGLGRVQFFIQANYGRLGAPHVAPGDTAGYFVIPPLAPLDTPYETLALKVFEGSTEVASFAPGSPGGLVPVRANYGYRVDLLYNVNVPFGIDPPANYDLTIDLLGAAAIPEPSLGLLVLFPLIGLRRGSAR